MKTKTAKKWGVPYGTWIYFDHSEAHSVGSSATIDQILAMIASIGWFAAAAAAQVFAQKELIHSKNKKSGRKGVKILFVWMSGMIMSIERQGKGDSPCC